MVMMMMSQVIGSLPKGTQMIILMLSQVIGSMENGNDDDEPGNRIFAARCLK